MILLRDAALENRDQMGTTPSKGAKRPIKLSKGKYTLLNAVVRTLRAICDLGGREASAHFVSSHCRLAADCSKIPTAGDCSVAHEASDIMEDLRRVGVSGKWHTWLFMAIVVT